MSHRLIDPEELEPPVGFTHAVAAAGGRTVYLAGQVGHDSAGKVAGPGIVEQFDRALANLLLAVEAAGGRPEHVVSMQVFVTDIAEYRDSRVNLGRAWRARFGRHYPAMGVLGVDTLFDPEAKVELMGIAVIPD
jgi:enamine deaminase RidA (YjgF/YER057c/UK114 family)